MPQDAGIRDFFKEIASYRTAWAQQAQLWESDPNWQHWSCMKSSRLETDCYDYPAGAGGNGEDDGKDAMDDGGKAAPKRANFRRRASSLSSSAMSSPKDSHDLPICKSEESLENSLDLTLTDAQRKELEDVLKAINSLEITAGE